MTHDEFWQDYKAALAQAMLDKPDDYLIADADDIAARMRAAVEKKGIGGVNIDSLSFKRLAKKYGMKNTYKAWTPFFQSLTV